MSRKMRIGPMRDAVRRRVDPTTILALLLTLSTRLFINERLAREGRWAERINYRASDWWAGTLA